MMETEPVAGGRRWRISCKRARRIHACKRARERFGLSPEEVKHCERQIKKAMRRMAQIRAGKEPTGEFPFAWRIEGWPGFSRARWRVRLEGRTDDIQALFDEALERVITFLPWEPKA
jgi:hypothetical protein